MTHCCDSKIKHRTWSGSGPFRFFFQGQGVQCFLNTVSLSLCPSCLALCLVLVVFSCQLKRGSFLFLSLLCVHLSRTCILVVVTVPKQLNSMKRQWSISSSMMVLKGCKSHTMKKLTYVLELFIFENHECPTFNLVNVKLENCVAVRW